MPWVFRIGWAVFTLGAVVYLASAVACFMNRWPLIAHLAGWCR